MSASGPLPECAPDFMVHPVERILGRAVSVVVGPATNNRVQQTNQHRLVNGLVRFDEPSDFLQERVRVLLRWFDQWLAVVLAEILSEEVEPLADMRDARLVGRERKPSVLQKLLHQGTDFLFQ